MTRQVRSSRVSRTVRTSHHVQAGVMVAGLVFYLRLIAELRPFLETSAALSLSLIAWPTCLLMIPIVRRSPPIAILFAVYGQILYGPYSFPGILFIPKIPFISVFTVWTVLLLWHRRRSDRTLGFLFSPFIVRRLTLIGVFLTIGIWGAWYGGWLNYSEARLYIIDYVRWWLGVMMMAMWACRSLRDIQVLFLGWPFAFLIYPISLPIQAWRIFFSYGISTTDVFSIGLGFGTLNVNYLGGAAAVAFVVAAACAFCLPPSRLRSWFIPLLMISLAIGLITASRQFMVSALLGLATIALAAKSRRGIFLTLTVIIIFFAGVLAFMNVMHQGSGFLTRYKEILTPREYENWESTSVTSRVTDFREAAKTWLDRPVLGHGYRKRPSHNVFLGILVETGVVGLALIMWLWFTTVRRFLRSVHRVAISSDEVRLVRTAVLAALACILVQQNISGGEAGGHQAYLVLGAMLGVIGFATSRAQTEQVRSKLAFRHLISGKR